MPQSQNQINNRECPHLEENIQKISFVQYISLNPYFPGMKRDDIDCDRKLYTRGIKRGVSEMSYVDNIMKYIRKA